MSDDKLKYEMKVTSIGPLVKEFVDAGILVFFGPEIPEELVEFSIVHEHGPLRSEVAPGDLILIDDEPFEVLAVGEVANKNLANLGHLILKANGRTEPELPGDVCVEAKPLPPVKVGTVVKILEGDS